MHGPRHIPLERRIHMKILMVLTSHDQLGNTGLKTGFWLEEFAAPYFVFRDAGVDLTVRTRIRSPWQNGVAESHLSCSSQVPFERAVGLHLLARPCAKGDPRGRRLSTSRASS